MTGTLQIKQLPSGNAYYYVKLSYKDPRTGGWKSKTCATGLAVKNNKRKAENKIKEYVDKYSYLEELPAEYNIKIDPNITLSDYVWVWLHGKERDLEVDTYEGYSYRAAKIAEYFKDKKTKLVDVTPKMIDVYMKYLLDYGKTNQKTHKPEPLAVRTVRSYKSLLYSIFSQAMIDGLVKYNPVQGIKVHGKKNKEYSEDFLFMTEDEILEFLQFIAEHYPRLLGITFLGAYYGLRRSEILGLKWDAIDLKRNKINFSHTVVRVKTVVGKDDTKTPAGRRSLFLFDAAKTCFEKIKEEQEANKRFLKDQYKNTEGYVFTWEDGALYDPNYISKLFKKATTEFGRPEITLHKLRHSCASMLINKGWDIKKLQYWLGHTDTATTLNIYSHFYRERLNASENDLQEISRGAGKLFA